MGSSLRRCRARIAPARADLTQHNYGPMPIIRRFKAWGRLSPSDLQRERYLPASSWSITAVKLSIGIAPTSRTPLTKKVGVPVTPYASPSEMSA